MMSLRKSPCCSAVLSGLGNGDGSVTPGTYASGAGSTGSSGQVHWKPLAG